MNSGGFTGASSNRALRMARIELRDIGCFDRLELSLESWSTILGDNAAGKSTLLRATVLGLCSESDAVALLKTLPGPLRRNGARMGEIRIELQDPDSGEVLSIQTKIEEEQSGDERVRKLTTPEDFPWDRIFVCGYGTNRTHRATSGFDEYSHLAAVRTLFPDPIPLQNPELILLRQENGLRRAMEERLLRIMMMDGARFSYTGKGPIIQSDRGDQPIHSLSDGYRSTLQWVLDFCAWAIYANRFGEGGVDGGILLVDELEQHLHPRWQRHIVSELRKQFPTTQILVTTHTPLLASGTADIESSQLVRLKEDPEGRIYGDVIEPASLSGQRADQVLTSEAFDLFTSRNRRGEDDLDRYAELLGKNPRTEEEEARFQALRLQLREALSLGETKTEREAERIVERVLDEMNTDLDKEHLDFESRKMLQELLRPGNET